MKHSEPIPAATHWAAVRLVYCLSVAEQAVSGPSYLMHSHLLFSALDLSPMHQHWQLGLVFPPAGAHLFGFTLQPTMSPSEW